MCYDEDEPKKLPETLHDCIEEIEILFENPPKDKRKRRQYQEWAHELNKLIKICNQKAGFTMYKPYRI